MKTVGFGLGVILVVSLIFEGDAAFPKDCTDCMKVGERAPLKSIDPDVKGCMTCVCNEGGHTTCKGCSVSSGARVIKGDSNALYPECCDKYVAFKNCLNNKLQHGKDLMAKNCDLCVCLDGQLSCFPKNRKRCKTVSETPGFTMTMDEDMPYPLCCPKLVPDN